MWDFRDGVLRDLFFGDFFKDFFQGVRDGWRDTSL